MYFEVCRVEVTLCVRFWKLRVGMIKLAVLMSHVHANWCVFVILFGWCSKDHVDFFLASCSSAQCR